MESKAAPPEIPGYTFLRSIGGGGFADVFLYEQAIPRRKVAIKVMRWEHADARSAEAFLVEANLMAAMSAHPYIASVFDAGVAPDGRPYLSMQYLQGGTLASLVRNSGPLPVPEVLDFGVKVAGALASAHQLGIIHGDVKPANLLLSDYGDPMLSDFGNSTSFPDRATLPAFRGMTVGFTAPELVSDERVSVSVSTDIYALGATIFALCEGHSPHFDPGSDNSIAAILHRVSSGSLPTFTRTDLPGALRHLIADMLSPDPENRPASAADVGRSLQSIQVELGFRLTPLMVAGTVDPRDSLPDLLPTDTAMDTVRRSAAPVERPLVPEQMHTRTPRDPDLDFATMARAQLLGVDASDETIRLRRERMERDRRATRTAANVRVIGAAVGASAAVLVIGLALKWGQVVVALALILATIAVVSTIARLSMGAVGRFLDRRSEGLESQALDLALRVRIAYVGALDQGGLRPSSDGADGGRK